MATYLYRLGRLAFRRRRQVVAGWLLLLALAGVGAAALSGPTSSTFSIPGTESSRALDVIDAKLGAGAGNATARVVFTADTALTSGASKAAVEAAVAALRTAPQVAAAADPYASETVSQDGRTAYATVTYQVPATEVTAEAREALFADGRSVQSAGVRAEFGGDATAEAEAGGPPRCSASSWPRSCWPSRSARWSRPGCRC